MKVSQVSLLSEGTAILSITFNPIDESIASMQFDLEYDRSSIELIATIGDATRGAQKALYLADVSPTKRRFLVYGTNQTAIQAGSVIDFIVGAAPGATLTTYPVRISDAVISRQDGFAVSGTLLDGGITLNAGAGSRLSVAGVRSAASLQPGTLAPGELVTLFGTGIGPTTSTLPSEGASSPILGGTSVWFGTSRAPLLYADSSQISAVVPFAVDGSSVNVQVQKNGSVWGSTQVPVQAASPAVFTMSWSGAGGGAILNQDTTLNDIERPAPRGTIVSIFATGAGQMNPAGTDGGIGKDTQFPILPVKVTVGGVAAEVLYSGAAPGLIEGVIQVNARIPEGAPVGPAVEVILQVGENRSPAGVTLAVR